MNKIQLLKKIKELKKEKNAIILAHYYQIPAIQDIADFVGDSLALSQKAKNTNADMIVFAGVHFMAEVAKILNADKKVVIPDIEAGCSLSDSCNSNDFKNFIDAHPDHVVISYINCSAEVKALSDIICTSGNAVKIVESFSKDTKIIFAPDKNLGGYINNLTGRNMVLWNGTCEVHDLLSLDKVIQLKLLHPDAKLIAHPECKAVILAISDYIGSTAALLNYTKSVDSKKFIVATETGIVHQMKLFSPEKEFIVAANDENCACNDCLFMKKNTVEKLYLCLKNGKPEIFLTAEMIEKAKKPILKMLELS